MGKVPAHATCVFKGTIFDVYQWEQELYDGTTKTFEILKRPDTTVVIALQGDQVYYAKQQQPNGSPYLSLFGGRAEPGEEPLQSAQRELLEETGFTSENWALLRTHHFPGKIDWTIYFFVARDCQKIADQRLDSGEKIEIRSCSVDDFITNIIAAKDFTEYELQQEVFSALNPVAAEKLKADILG